MIVGFNHNFLYKGEVYHVQTEDGGLKNPNLITLLYKGGTILFSKKTTYSDITRVEKLEKVVEELMKEQHREMLRRLKNGDFDQIIEKYKNLALANSAASPALDPLRRASEAVPPLPAEPVTAKIVESAGAEASLDEIILSYLVGEEERE
jgi:hypothetical protein